MFFIPRFLKGVWRYLNVDGHEHITSCLFLLVVDKRSRWRVGARKKQIKKNRLMVKRLLFATLMALCAATALAYDFSAVAPSGQTLYYNIVDGHAEVVRSTSSYVTGDLVIPSTVTYNDVSYTVTSIGSYAFQNCGGLTSVSSGSIIHPLSPKRQPFCANATCFSDLSVPPLSTAIRYCITQTPIV